MANYERMRTKNSELYSTYLNWALFQIYEYLDEKGVFWRFPGPYEARIEDSAMLLEGVNPRLFHQVVVPGLRAMCKRLKIRLKALDYVRREETCDFAMKLWIRYGDATLEDLLRVQLISDGSPVHFYSGKGDPVDNMFPTPPQWGTVYKDIEDDTVYAYLGDWMILEHEVY